MGHQKNPSPAATAEKSIVLEKIIHKLTTDPELGNFSLAAGLSQDVLNKFLAERGRRSQRPENAI